jgi:Na+/H+-dicarboxylate symporter
MNNNLLTALQDNWITLLISAVVIVGLIYLAKKRVGFGTRVMIALGAGLGAGLLFNSFAWAFEGVSTIGSIYVNLIRMIVIPLVFVLVVNSIISITNIAFLRKIGIKTISWFLATTGIAAIIGLTVALLINPAGSFEASTPQGFEAREIPSFFQVILDQLPNNPIQDAANGKVLPILIFGLFIAVAIVKVGAKKPEAVEPVKALFASLTEVLHQVVKFVLRFTPYGVYALIAAMAARYGWETLEPLIWLIIVSYIALIIHFVFVFGGLISGVGKLNPLQFFKKAYPTIAVAFSTRSSYATLPVNLEVLTKRVGVSSRIASFVAPLGATMNFNGCGGIWPAIVAVFVSNVYGVPLSVTDYVLIVVVSVISSIGVAGVPGPASISTTVVLTALGLPLEGIALVVAVESLIDMGRTAVNATGTTVVATLIAKSENELDQGVYQRKDTELELTSAV